MIDYKFNEGVLIQELKNYIDSTYDGHYSKNNFQSTEFIIDCGHGMGFALGNVLKYAQRYGKKDGTNRKDLMKILHYALIALHQHDLDEASDTITLDLSDSITFDFPDAGDNISFVETDIYTDMNMCYNSTIEGIDNEDVITLSPSPYNVTVNYGTK